MHWWRLLVWINILYYMSSERRIWSCFLDMDSVLSDVVPLCSTLLQNPDDGLLLKSEASKALESYIYVKIKIQGMSTAARNTVCVFQHSRLGRRWWQSWRLLSDCSWRPSAACRSPARRCGPHRWTACRSRRHLCPCTSMHTHAQRWEALHRVNPIILLSNEYQIFKTLVRAWSSCVKVINQRSAELQKKLPFDV